jgi:hypothetical protein
MNRVRVPMYRRSASTLLVFAWPDIDVSRAMLCTSLVAELRMPVSAFARRYRRAARPLLWIENGGSRWDSASLIWNSARPPSPIL